MPQPPPANVNGPSLPPGIAPPPITAPPPFGNLSRAAEFGIKSYNQLVKAVQGTGLEGHHLLEQRFLRYMGGDPRMSLSVAVTAAEHQLFTNAWRSRIPYGSAPTVEKIVAEARIIYNDYPAILQALGL